MTRLLILALALSPLAACSNNDDRDDTFRDSDSPATTVSAGDEEIRGRTLAVESNTGNEMEIGVTDEVVFLRLTESARAEVEKEMEREMPEDGFGASIGRAVTGMVSNVLDMTVQIPLEEVDDMRYENGRLVLDSDVREANFEINDNDAKNGIEFDEDAAERLIDAFERAR